MNASKQVRILVAGDVRGQFDALIKRVLTINAKVCSCQYNNVFICSRLDHSNCYFVLANSLVTMLNRMNNYYNRNSTFQYKHIYSVLHFFDYTPRCTISSFLGPCCSSTAAFYPKDGGELSLNLTYLGKKGLLTTASGVSVAYLSGVESATATNMWNFDAETIDQLLVPVKVGGGYIGVDVLLTNQWPAQILKYAPNQLATPPDTSSELISKLAAGLKPRYHFCGMGSHYERAPYRFVCVF